MSQVCAVNDCKKGSRALCNCCQQNLCRDHLNEHDDLLNAQLNPCADQINILQERLSQIPYDTYLNRIDERLEEWRLACHQQIDQFVQEKREKIQNSIRHKMQHEYQEIHQLSQRIRELIELQGTTVEDLNRIALAIRTIENDIAELEYLDNEIRFNQLNFNDHLIEINEKCQQSDFDLTLLRAPIQRYERSAESSKPMASNHRVLLTHQDNHLCVIDHNMKIIKQIRWPHSWIWDICWSATLSRFVLITLSKMFLFDDLTMSIENVPLPPDTTVSSCTCSNKSLYIATQGLASSILEYQLTPTFTLINRWQSADLCQYNETIQDIRYHKRRLAIIIENQVQNTKRMDLRWIETFDLIWSIQFGLVDPLRNAYRLCLLNSGDWLVIDWRSSQIFHVTKEGLLKSNCTYDPVPYRCCQFGNNLLAISTRTSVHLHAL